MAKGQDTRKGVWHPVQSCFFRKLERRKEEKKDEEAGKRPSYQSKWNDAHLSSSHEKLAFQASPVAGNNEAMTNEKSIWWWKKQERRGDVGLDG